MLIVYYSMTGNCRRFVNSSGIADEYETIELKKDNIDDTIDEPFLLVTPTINFGEVPPMVQRFLQKNYSQLIGVASSGNRNWGGNYAKAGDRISEDYHVPLIMKFELHGNKQSRKEFKEKVGALNESIRREKV